MNIVLIIIAILLAIVFMINVHVGMGCLMGSFRPSRPPVPPEPLATSRMDIS